MIIDPGLMQIDMAKEAMSGGRYRLAESLPMLVSKQKSLSGTMNTRVHWSLCQSVILSAYKINLDRNGYVGTALEKSLNALKTGNT